ncbi:MAG: plasmid mobilization relaxosome protein MobC [Steroidobacteraceae bacterium]
MAAEAFIQCRVSQVTKAALRAAAERQQVTESALLKRMLDLVLQTASAAVVGDAADAVDDRRARQARLYVRLTRGDRQLLEARSAARSLAPATYVAILLRAHLRALTPLPEAELRAIRQATRELAAIGRNLNQIAHATNMGGSGDGVTRGNLLSLLKACEALRDHIRAYVSTNLASWASGDAAA